MWETLGAGKTWEGEIQNRKKSGESYWVYAVISPRFDKESGTLMGYTALRQDITDKKRIEMLSITDVLTGLYNRRYFNQVFDREIRRAKRDRKCLAFAIADIDHFKEYNDTYGHEAGDEALAKIGQALGGCFKRASDYAFRLGGEEFGLLFEEERAEEVASFIHKIRQTIEDLGIVHEKNGPDSVITISIGAVARRMDEEEGEKGFYKAADDALYEAKHQGRNQVVFRLL